MTKNIIVIKISRLKHVQKQYLKTLIRKQCILLLTEQQKPEKITEIICIRVTLSKCPKRPGVDNENM